MSPAAKAFRFIQYFVVFVFLGLLLFGILYATVGPLIVRLVGSN
jgi:hypothetical protein